MTDQYDKRVDFLFRIVNSLVQMAGRVYHTPTHRLPDDFQVPLYFPLPNQCIAKEYFDSF